MKSESYNYSIATLIALGLVFLIQFAQCNSIQGASSRLASLEDKVSALDTEFKDTSGLAVIEDKIQGLSQKIDQLASTRSEPAVAAETIVPAGGEETQSPAETYTPPPPFAPDPGSEIIVHVTRTGSKYHSAGCRYLSKSDIPITLEDAKAQGYGACSVCGPPR